MSDPLIDPLTAPPATSAPPQRSTEDRPATQPAHRDLSPVDLDQMLDQALRTGPDPAVPSDFAARVLSRLPSSSIIAPAPIVPGTPPMLYAERAMMLCLVALLGALLVTAPYLATGSPRLLAIQWTISAQVALIAVSLAKWRSPRQLPS